MARTVVYSASEDGTRAADGPAAKVAKYVPAEIVAIAALFFSQFTLPTEGWIWAAVVAGALLNIVYLASVAYAPGSTAPPPTWWFYALSALAFPLWAIATIDAVGGAAGLNGSSTEGQRAFVLTLAAFAIPTLDVLFSGIGDRRKRREERTVVDEGGQGEDAQRDPATAGTNGVEGAVADEQQEAARVSAVLRSAPRSSVDAMSHQDSRNLS